MYIAMDSVSYAALSGLKWPHKIGYYNGRVSAWSPQEIADTRAGGQLLALVDVLGTEPLEASILDFERGDVQSPAVVHAWVQARNQFRGDAVVYCSAANIATVVSGLAGEPCNLWVVDLTADGMPPFDPPAYPGLPANVRVIGRQFVLGPRSGGNYDLSVFYVDAWHPEQQAPAAHTGARFAAAAELGQYGFTAGLPTGLPSATLPAPVPSSPTSTPVPAPVAAATVPDPVQSAMAAMVAPPHDELAGIAAQARQILTTPAPGPAAAAADPPPETGLNHTFIQSTLNDLSKVARMFRATGHGTMAAELEHVSGMAWELGSALKTAGF